MNPLVAEFLGTLVLVLMGNGVVCNVVLPKTKGNGAGLIVIATGWAFAVFCGASIAMAASGGHLNPAVSLGLFIVGKMSLWATVTYIMAQLSGAVVGAWLLYQYYRDHFHACTSGDEQLACFATSPAIRNVPRNFLSETVATFVLIFVILNFQPPKLDNAQLFGLGNVDLLPVTLLVFGIGVSLGGTTGYAINPVRDLGPRLVHHFLSMPNKRDSDWPYAWVPVLGPVCGAVIAATLHLVVS